MMKSAPVWGVMLAWLLAACGSGSGSGSGAGGSSSGPDPHAQPPSIDGSILIYDLSSSQLGELCDWYADLVAGGYDQVECGDVTALPTSGSRETCIENSQSNNGDCDATVDDWIACAEKLAAAGPCDTGAFEDAQASDECSYYYGTNLICSNIN